LLNLVRKMTFYEFINLGEVKKSDFNCLNPRGEFWHRLEGALDVSKNVSEPAKSDLGNRTLRHDPCGVRVTRESEIFFLASILLLSFPYAGVPLLLSQDRMV